MIFLEALNYPLKSQMLHPLDAQKMKTWNMIVVIHAEVICLFGVFIYKKWLLSSLYKAKCTNCPLENARAAGRK